MYYQSSEIYQIRLLYNLKVFCIKSFFVRQERLVPRVSVQKPKMFQLNPYRVAFIKIEYLNKLTPYIF